MKRNKHQSTFVNIGSSSLLIIFLILCLTTFAILSLSSAQSDYSFSKKSAQHKTEYYEASSTAELILGEIDDTLAENTKKADKASLIRLFDRKEVDGITLSCTNTDGVVTISYQVPSGAKHALSVTLLVTEDAENYYKIQTWQLISTGSWNADDSLKLMPVGK